MKILFVGKHGNGKNDDEGSIVYSLEHLGHEVLKMTERQAHFNNTTGEGFDFCLFNHWSDLEAIDRIKIPKVFWYFDLVDWPDPTIRKRCNTRKRWMREITPRVDLGFCTDGDWVNQDTSGKLIRLTQGADPRILGRGESSLRIKHKLLFTGMELKCDSGRREFVGEMRNKYKHHFHHVSGMGGLGIYGRKLANLIADTQIIIAPDSPVTDHYWSNRIYNALGFGGFLLHPYCKALEDEYGSNVPTYNSMKHLHFLIKEYLSAPQLREQISDAGLQLTRDKHTYIHRCKTLINTVQERLGI